MAEKMTRQRVEAIIEAYGSEAARWPDDEREQALQVLGNSPELADLRKQAEELDHWLSRSEVPPASARLQRAILGAALKRQRDDLAARLLDWLFPSGRDLLFWLWRPTLAATLPLLMGFLVGTTTTTPSDEWDTWEEELYISGFVSVDSGTDPLAIETDVAGDIVE